MMATRECLNVKSCAPRMREDGEGVYFGFLKGVHIDIYSLSSCPQMESIGLAFQAMKTLGVPDVV